MKSEAINTEELLQVALDSAGLGSWELYLSTGTVHRTARHDEIFGYCEIQPFRDIETTLAHIADQDQAAVRKVFCEAELTGEIDIEARLQRSSKGEPRWVHLRGQAFYVEGIPTRIAGVIGDAAGR